jgi:hypothetical protein
MNSLRSLCRVSASLAITDLVIAFGAVPECDAFGASFLFISFLTIVSPSSSSVANESFPFSTTFFAFFFTGCEVNDLYFGY